MVQRSNRLKISRWKERVDDNPSKWWIRRVPDLSYLAKILLEEVGLNVDEMYPLVSKGR